MATVASLWVGGPLGKIQEICLASFVYYGHSTYLYVYDMELEVPDGIIKLDANDIIPESEIFYHWGQLAGFSDLFRYKMIRDTGMMWVDADTLCLTENFFDTQEIVFINENNVMYAGGILKIPQNHELVNYLYEKALDSINSKEDTHWSFIGPRLIDEAVKKMSLEKYAVNSKIVNVFKHAKDAQSAWIPAKRREVLRRMSTAHCATFFNGGLTMANFNKNNIVNNSAIHYFYNKYVVGKK
jgi:hypothetical protein